MAKGGEFILPDASKDVFTVHDLTEEQNMFRFSLKKFMTNEVLSQSDKIESKDWDVTRSLLLGIGGLGALGVEVPEEYGGAGLDKTTAAILAEEVGGQGSFACTVLADTGIGLLPILLFGTEEQKKRFVPGIVAGKLIGAYCLTESGAGSDAKAIKTKAVLSDDGRAHILNGEKIFVTGGGLADVYTVFAKVGDDKEITAFIVERGFAGIEVGKEEHKMGILGSSTTSLKLTDVRVSIENVLGQIGEGFNIAMNILNLGRFKLGSACLGGAKQSFSESLGYSKTRKQFGVTIGTFGATRNKLCRMAALIYGMEAIVYRTAGLMDGAISAVGQNDPQAMMKAIREYAGEASMVKVFCSEAGHDIALENVMIHGGNGFMKDYPAERHLRDSIINMIFEGTNPVNRLLMVKEIMKKMAISLIQEGKKIQSEILSGPVSLSTDLDQLAVLESQLKGAKKALIAGGGSVIQKFGLKLVDNDNQEVVMLIADCMTRIYVLDSALAVYTKHKREQDEYLTRYLFHIFLPEIERDIKTLVAMGLEGDEQKTILVAVRKLFKYSPENLLYLNKKIAEKFG